jgi:hypothetical protein
MSFLYRRWRQAKKVEAQLLEQLDRDEQRGSRTGTVTELVGALAGVAPAGPPDLAGDPDRPRRSWSGGDGPASVL